MQRVVLLGASNLTQGLPVALDLLRSGFDQPLEMFVAGGHGRSFGRWSRFLYVRQLPGLVNCQLWPALACATPADRPPLAVITDIGNDLFYGCSVATVSTWVYTCIQRLQERNTEVLLTTLPMDRLERLSAGRYYLMRSLLFPACRIDWDTMKSRAYALHAALQKLAERNDVKLIVPASAWYGRDPLHIRRGQQVSAWTEILRTSDLFPDSDGSRQTTAFSGESGVTLSTRLKLLRLGPAEKKLFGRLTVSPQPAARWSDGSSLRLY